MPPLALPPDGSAQHVARGARWLLFGGIACALTTLWLLFGDGHPAFHLIWGALSLGGVWQITRPGRTTGPPVSPRRLSRALALAAAAVGAAVVAAVIAPSLGTSLSPRLEALIAHALWAWPATGAALALTLGAHMRALTVPGSPIWRTLTAVWRLQVAAGVALTALCSLAPAHTIFGMLAFPAAALCLGIWITGAVFLHTRFSEGPSVDQVADALGRGAIRHAEGDTWIYRLSDREMQIEILDAIAPPVVLLSIRSPGLSVAAPGLRVQHADDPAAPKRPLDLEDPILARTVRASGTSPVIARALLADLHSALLPVLCELDDAWIADGVIRARRPADAVAAKTWPARDEGVEWLAALARALDERARQIEASAPPDEWGLAPGLGPLDTGPMAVGAGEE